MNLVMTVADQTINDLALFAAMLALAAVLVVAALWTAAHLRVDHLLRLALREVGAGAKHAIAAVGAAGSLAILLGFVPSSLLLDPWAAGAAALWIIMSVVAVSAAATGRRRRAAADARTMAQELPPAKAA
ncbi:MAG TPA: hypothetical protein VD997_12815 [Phycisphaerales bacterium]|nr:hypothetical protein [Phycisphaerales bacterium]